MSSNAAVRHYRFDRFELRPRDRRLLNEGKPVPVTPRAFDVLVTLVERAGDLVSKEELLESAWAGLVVEENNLHVQVSALRRLLGPHTIATVPGHGYRFATPVSCNDPVGPAESTAHQPIKRGLPPSTGDVPPIYGRGDDLLVLRNMIAAHALVTIVGPAGIGKTRLAEATARDAGDAFAERACFVEFAQLADPALVPVTVSRALGIAVGDPDSALELTVHALTGRQMLLILDNCEHLLDAVDRFVSALRKSAPGVHVLITSQELLRHADEHVYRIGPLALPAESTAASAHAAGATELFAARVQALEPRFDLTDANVAAVIDICRRLDGIPLDSSLPRRAFHCWAWRGCGNGSTNGFGC